METNNVSIFQAVLDFVFPPLCVGCGEYTENADSICLNCLNSIEKIDDVYCLKCDSSLHGLNQCDICTTDSLLLYSYGEYHSALKEMIIQFKFKGITKPAEFFSKRIVDQFAESILSHQADFLIPIPLTSSRENKRGYNQAVIIADHLSQLLNIKINKEILFRTKNSMAQSRLPLKERKENIKSVFSVNEEGIDKFRLLLVDDVVTSGSTVKEAASVLTEAGHTVSGVIALAHAYNL